MNQQPSPRNRAPQSGWALEDTMLFDMPPAFEDSRTPEERREAAEKRLTDLTRHFAEIPARDE